MKNLDHLLAAEAILSAYPPDGDSLLAFVSQQVTEEILWEIASVCDFGVLPEDQYPGIRDLRDGIPLDPQGWVPNSLFTCVDFEESQTPLGERDFHIAKVFSLAALLYVRENYPDRWWGRTSDFAPLLQSCLKLEQPFLSLLASKLTSIWMTKDPWEEDFLFAPFSLLVVHVVGFHEPDPTITRVLGDWLVRANREIVPWHSCMHPRARSFASFDRDERCWKGFAEELRGSLSSDSPIHELLALITA